MHTLRHSWQPAPQITGRLHGTLEIRKEQSPLKFKKVCAEGACSPPQHIQGVACVSLPLERSVWDLQCLQKFKFFWTISQSISFPCIRGRTDFSHVEGRVPSAESQLSVLEKLFLTKSCASNSGSMCNFVLRSSSVLPEITCLCKSQKWCYVSQNKHSKYICFIILIDVLLPTSEEVKAVFLLLETVSDKHTYSHIYTRMPVCLSIKDNKGALIAHIL